MDLRCSAPQKLDTTYEVHFFMPNTQKNRRRYDAEFKINAILDMWEHHLSFEETAQKYWPGLTRSESHNHVKSLKLWERICLEEGVSGIMKQRRSRVRGAGKDRPRKLDTSTEEDLIAENQRLRMEIAYLKKLSALVLANEQAKRNGRRSSQN